MSITQTTDLDRLIEPCTVAYVGASENSAIFRSLHENNEKTGSTAESYFVNPNRDEIFGQMAYDSVLDIEERVDLAVLCVPTAYVVPSFEECCEAGINAALIVSSLEAEEGQEALEDRLRELSEEHDVHLCGPNASGILCPRTNLGLSMTGIPDGLQAGGVGVVSQSGGLIVTLLRSGRERGFGFSTVIDSGNQTVLSTADYMEYLVEDDETEVIVGIVEAFADPEKFQRVARRANELGMPILILKLAQSEAGRAAAESHTGSITSSAEIVSAAFKRSNVVEYDETSTLVEAIELFSKAKPARGDRVGVVGTCGGGTTLFSDGAAKTDLILPAFSEETRETLGELLPPQADLSNPLDPVFVWHFPVMDDIAQQIFDALEADENVDVVVVQLQQMSSADDAMGFQRDRFEEIVEANADSDTQFVVVTRPTYRILSEWVEVAAPSDIPVVQDRSRSLAVIEDYVNYSQGRELPASVQARDGRDAIRINADGDVVNEYEAKQILGKHGFPVVDEGLAHTKVEAVDVASKVDYPVCLKVVSDDIVHKMDIDAVATDLGNESAVETAYDEILDSVAEHTPDASVEGILVQEMVTDGVEAFVGAKRTKFGPAVTTGFGGIYTEILDDTATALVPFSKTDAREMIESLRGAELFRGARGSEAIDVDAFAALLAEFSEFVADLEDVREVDLNPVIVTPDGLHLVDAVFYAE